MAETRVGEAKHTQPEKTFIFRGGALAFDLLNTEIVVRGKRRDLLTTPQAVLHWWQAACDQHPQREMVQGRDENEMLYDVALLDALKTFRMALRGIFSALVERATPDREDVNVLNGVLEEGHIAVDLKEDGELQSVYRTADTKGGAILLPVALSALHLIQGSERKRLHQCENERCILFFYDSTRSATRRWCSLGCMDRARSLQRYRQAKLGKSPSRR